MYSRAVDTQPKFVFVVGFARSGTTLVATLLDRHSAIAATPETQFFSRFLPRRTASATRGRSRHLVESFLASERIQDLQLSIVDFAGLLATDECTWKDVFSHALTAYAARHSALIVAEKTPAHMTKVPRILEWYPEARIVYVVRDGRDAALSLLRAPWTHCNLRRHARTWRWCVKRMAAFQRCYPRHVLEVRYESLLERPEETLRTIMDFIGVPYEASQLIAGDAARTIPDWEIEWKGKATEELDKGRIQAWKRTATAPERLIMNSMMGGALRMYGYDDTGLAGYPLRRRGVNAVLNALYLVLYHPRIKPLFVAVKRALLAAGVPTDRIDRPGRAGG